MIEQDVMNAFIQTESEAASQFALSIGLDQNAATYWSACVVAFLSCPEKAFVSTDISKHYLEILKNSIKSLFEHKKLIAYCLLNSQETFVQRIRIGLETIPPMNSLADAILAEKWPDYCKEVAMQKAHEEQARIDLQKAEQETQAQNARLALEQERLLLLQKKQSLAENALFDPISPNITPLVPGYSQIFSRAVKKRCNKEDVQTTPAPRGNSNPNLPPPPDYSRSKPIDSKTRLAFQNNNVAAKKPEISIDFVQVDPQEPLKRQELLELVTSQVNMCLKEFEKYTQTILNECSLEWEQKIDNIKAVKSEFQTSASASKEAAPSPIVVAAKKKNKK